MKIIISPAKSLDLESKYPNVPTSDSIFEKQAWEINKKLRNKSPKSLIKLMNISDNLAQLNWQRNQDFCSSARVSRQARPAIYCFDGEVYKGIDIHSFPNEKIKNLQNDLFILSGLYGLLRPLDIIQPYRLEMGTQISIGGYHKLSDYWNSRVTKTIKSSLKSDEVLVNLASKEYSDAVDISAIPSVVTPQFRDYKNGIYKVVSFFAKKARGLMTRYLILNQASGLSDILSFDIDGYCYSPEHTLSEDKPVFIR